MATKHNWWDNSWNLVTGCTRVSAACDHCYARRTAETRLRGKYGYPADEPFRVTVHPDKFDAPLHWRKPRRIFVCSMGDLFHPEVPIKVHDRVLVAAYLARQHTFLLCTKRPERITETWAETQSRCGWVTEVVQNIHLGTTVEHQDTVDRIGHLLDTPAAVHWISFEPLLGPVCVPELYWGRLTWIVIGCETGTKRRPCNLDWVKSLVYRARNLHIPIWVKQLNINGRVSHDPAEWPEWARLRELPREVTS
jgi:protein gp37